MRFRFASLLLVAVTAVALVGCAGGDDDDATAAPVPLAQRFVTGEDAPGSQTEADDLHCVRCRDLFKLRVTDTLAL